MREGIRKDLIVLVADQDIEFAIKGLLGRPEALGIRKTPAVQYDIFRHLGRDPSCLLESHEFLRPFIARYAYGMVVFDREGCGREDQSRGHLETEVEDRLRVNGWGDRSAVIVLDPELEIWVWSRSPHVDTILGWKDRSPGLDPWLVERGFKEEGAEKPSRPKEAVEHALRMAHKSQSASVYEKLARSVSLNACVDPAFDKFRMTLQKWFPVQ